MKTYFLLSMCVFVINLVQKNSAYKICGDSKENEEVKPAVDEIVKRLMKARTPDWGWETFSTAITLQVSAPEKFFKRDSTADLLKNIIELEWEYLDLLDLAEFSFAARALCLDPEKIGGRNLLKTIRDEIDIRLQNTTYITQDIVAEYTLITSALCINHYSLEKHFVDRLLEAQNPDGSFGEPEFAVSDTIWMLRPLQCLSQMKDPTYNVTKVAEVVKQMREFIIKTMHKTEDGRVYFGEDETTTNDAIIGLWYSRQPGESPTRWNCDQAMRTLGVKPKDGEDETALSERLLRITASDFLELHDVNYKCLDLKDIEPAPRGYRPICNYMKPVTCGGVVPKKKRKRRSVFDRMAYFTD